jgi:hypothetical protein
MGIGIGALLALSSLAGCSPEPCTSCLKVGGAYTATTEPKTVDCQAWMFLLFGGGESSVTLAQAGSDLTLTFDDFGLAVSGVLHSDQSASFGPQPITFMPVDGAGNPDPSGSPTPGKLYAYGFFSGSQGHVRFDGTYVLKTDDSVECELDSKVTWTKR